ncbi:MAG: hypothetical protein ACKN97_07495 [Acidobacteriota bacterium]
MADNLVVLSSISNIANIYDRLYEWCNLRDFSGADPFDGLNSKYFQRSPLKRFALARLAFLQLVKRSHRDLRSTFKVSEDVNSKALALFALAEMSRFRATGDERHAQNGRQLLDRLSTLAIDLRDAGLAWGYNFDWQSRAFFAPKGTPTIVPTAFAARAFAEGAELFGDHTYAEKVIGVSTFIRGTLNRSFETDTELCFSYTPLDTSLIFNASLLAAESLALAHRLTGDGDLKILVEKSLRYVINRQKADGGWDYGTRWRHRWMDNFHTAYILLSIHRLKIYGLNVNLPIEKCLVRGIDFWIDNFFLDDGTPKYFPESVHPVDIHSAAAAIGAAMELSTFNKRGEKIGRNVLRWTIRNMMDEEGFFYYQISKKGKIKTPFMRWGQAWMAHALAAYLECDKGGA